MVQQERQVCLILSGGSICMQPSPDGYIPTKGLLLAECLATSPSLNDLRTAAPSPASNITDEIGVTRPGDASFLLPANSPGGPRIRYTAFEFRRLIDSCAADAHFWNILASCIVANYDSFDGFVLIHGTDTLSYAASALSFLLNPLNKPVVLTGSQVSIFDRPTDAWDNILGALHCAAAMDTKYHEVGLFFHGTLHQGNRSTKVHSSEYAAFATPKLCTPLSKLEENVKKPTPSTPPLSSSPMHRSITKHALTLEPLAMLRPSDVAVLRIYPGITPSVISALVSTPSLRGLVLETYGAGSMFLDSELRSIIKYAIEERGLVIVNVSQCLNGTVTTHYASAKALQDLGVVHGRDMTTEAAFTKLLWLLAHEPTLGFHDVRLLMSRNLRGELNEFNGIAVAKMNTVDVSKAEPKQI